MHQIRFPLGLHPRPRTPLWEITALPMGLLLYLRGLLLRGERGRGTGKGRKCKADGRGEEVDGEIWPTQKFSRCAPYAWQQNKEIWRVF